MTAPASAALPPSPARESRGRRLRVAVLWLGQVSRDTAGRTYLRELLGPLGALPDLEVELHVADVDFEPPTTCTVISHRVPHRFGSFGRIVAEQLVARSLWRRCDVLLAPFGNVPLGWRSPAVAVHHNVLAFGGDVRRELSLSRAIWRPIALRTSLRRATRNLTVSAYLRTLLLERFRFVAADAVDVVPLGVNPAAPREEHLEARRAPRLLAVSALWPYKRIDLAIEALGVLRSSEPGATLDVAGPGGDAERARLREVATRAGVGDAVAFLGNVPPERLASLYREADVLLYLSDIESFGLPVVEAMEAGLPVVAKRIPGILEVGGDAPFWVDADADADAVAAVVRELLADDGLREAHVERGRARARGFTWQRTAELTAEALRTAAGVRTAATS